MTEGSVTLRDVVEVEDVVVRAAMVSAAPRLLSYSLCGKHDLGVTLKVPGWRIDGWSAQAFERECGATFGKEEAPSAYSAAVFVTETSRPESVF